MEKVNLRIGGMHCGGCADIVRHVLEREPGVKGCSVSVEDALARVAFEPADSSVERLERAVSRAGYTAERITE